MDRDTLQAGSGVLWGTCTEGVGGRMVGVIPPAVGRRRSSSREGFSRTCEFHLSNDLDAVHVRRALSQLWQRRHVLLHLLKFHCCCKEKKKKTVNIRSLGRVVFVFCCCFFSHLPAISKQHIATSCRLVFGTLTLLKTRSCSVTTEGKEG